MTPEKQVAGNIMLKEYVWNQNAGCWHSSMPGVQICRFSLLCPEQTPLRTIPVCGAPLQFEALFCLSGRLAVQRRNGGSCGAESRGIFLLSDSSGLHSCQYSGNLSGILMSVDARAARESLMAVCAALGMKLDTRIVKRKMAASGGCMALHSTAWTQAFFEILRRLPEEVQERYCIFKAVELLYLLCTETSASDEIPLGSEAPVPHDLSAVRDYLQAHLAEKVTIGLLCKQFSLSPTFLKSGFRRAYGVPIHTYLIQQRLHRARELICTTRLPIQQIAQTVGYEGMSQFNAAFRREYGMTPGQYRKMSETAVPRPF